MFCRFLLAPLAAVFLVFSPIPPGYAQQASCPNGMLIDEGGNCVQWTIVSSGQRPRVFHTVTELADGRILIAGGERTSVSVSEPEPGADCQIYDPQRRVWLIAGDMNSARTRHSAVRLQDGSVLVVGGFQLNRSSYVLDSISTVERFDPETLTWRSVASLPFSSGSHTTTLMDDGRVLFVGEDVLFYDPELDSWSEGPEIDVGRIGHTAHRLEDGSILIVGGCFGREPTSSVVAFDPEDLSWSDRTSTNESHCGHLSTQLPNGQVVIAGGISDAFEIYNPDEDSWASIPGLLVSRQAVGGVVALTNQQVVIVGQETRLVRLIEETWEVVATTRDYWMGRSATLLNNGEILIIAEDGASATSTVLSPETWSFVPSSNDVLIHQNSTATLLDDGRVLVVGGEYFDYIDVDGAFIFDPISSSWEQVASMSNDRHDHTATRLLDGRVLVTGGEIRSDNNTEIYDPVSDTWSNVPDCDIGRREHIAERLPSGDVLITAGVDMHRDRLTSSLIFDSTTNSCHEGAPLNTPRSESTAVSFHDGRIAVIGGYGTDGSLTSVEVFDPSTRLWDSFELDRPMYQNMSVSLDDGRVLLSGGSVHDEIVSDACLLDVEDHSCTSVAPMNIPRREHLGVLLADGRALVVGGRTPGGDTGTAEIYDPIEDTWTLTADSWAPRRPDSLTALSDGRVLAMGGFYISAELFQMTSP